MIKEVKNGVYIKDDVEIPFSYCSSLYVSEKIDFIEQVTSFVVDEDSYKMLAKDLFFDFVYIAKFTDINLDYIFESENALMEIELFFENNNVMDVIKDNNVGLLLELNIALEKNIEYKTGIHTNHLNEVLESFIKTLENKAETIDLEQIGQFMGNFNKTAGDFTPENIALAYYNSPMYKETQERIMKGKEAHINKINELVEL